MNAARKLAPQAGRVMTHAVIRAAHLLEVSQARMAEILGVSSATASRMVSGGYQLLEDSKQWELAALFVRLFRSLDAIVGSSDNVAKQWLWSENSALGGIPGDLILTTEGLVRAVHYLDAARGRL